MMQTTSTRPHQCLGWTMASGGNHSRCGLQSASRGGKLMAAPQRLRLAMYGRPESGSNNPGAPPRSASEASETSGFLGSISCYSSTASKG